MGPLPPVIAGKYRPLRLIARGGMGAVYEVVHANTGEHLALKLMLSRSLLTPELVERFRREARVSSSVRSEHVVKVVDADVARELDDAPFLVMELLEGQDLERICLERPPAADEVVDWMRQLAAALDKAHAEGIVHRDLKPENLFLARRDDLPPIVKILDFGIAKMAGESAGLSTATGQILGTPRYMAPEQAAAAKEVSAAADRFALGLIAFRLLCGRHYFPGDNWIALLREVARGPMVRPSEMGCDRGRAFDAWFAKACAFDPRARFATCADQVAALGPALASVPSRGTRSRAALALAVLGACALGGAGWRLARAPSSRAASSTIQPTEAAVRTPAPLPPPQEAASTAPPRPNPASAVEPERATPTPLARKPGVSRQRKRAVSPINGDAKKPEPERDRVWNEP
jgi:serine/threonine-protein kinase